MPDNSALAERRAALLQAAVKVGHAIASILDPEELLRQTVDIICDQYGFYYAGVFLLDGGGEWAVLRAGRGEAGAAMVAEGHRLRVGGHSMIGMCIEQRRARIALDVGEEPVHFRNPHLPHTRSEMALPLLVGREVIGALTVQSVEEAAFSDEDIASLQAMADQLAVAIHNAYLLRALEAAHAELLRTKTFEAIATTTLEAIHWIGNKALPISTSVARLRSDLERLPQAEPEVLESMREDLALIEDSVGLIHSVQEHLIGPAREERPGPTMLHDVLKDTVVALRIPAQMVTLTVAPEVTLGRADTTQLSRAFEYVLQNALEAVAGADERRIVLEVAPAEDPAFIVTRIADSGPGIPEEELDKIWAAFYTTKGARHAGLGLSATLNILRQIDGQVAARNAPEGGAVFELLVPVYDAPLPVADLPKTRRFLLVDDDDAWSRFAIRALQDAGNVVVRSDDGQVEPAEFDRILVDDVLEKADSLEVVRRLASAGVGGRTVVVASRVRVERATALLQAGAQDVVPKPYTAAALAEVVA